MDFLSKLFDGDWETKNPFKTFVALVIYKFEQIEECDKTKKECDEKRDEAISEIEADVLKIKENLLTKEEKKSFEELKTTKVDYPVFNKHLNNYNEMKGRWTAYIVIITIVFNLAIWLIKELVAK